MHKKGNFVSFALFMVMLLTFICSVCNSFPDFERGGSTSLVVSGLGYNPVSELKSNFCFVLYILGSMDQCVLGWFICFICSLFCQKKLTLKMANNCKYST